jgi:TRAP-type C4-dicarboxylate transport system permease small subunit
MRNRRRTGVVLGVLWLVAILVLVATVIYFGDSRVAQREGFPWMPLYGAVTWWFFLSIPLIGATYGFFNDWRDR